MWNKINDKKYQLNFDKNFTVEFKENDWYLINGYKNVTVELDGIEVEEKLTDALDVIFIKIIEDIDKASKTIVGMLEILKGLSNSYEDKSESIVDFDNLCEKVKLKSIQTIDSFK